MQVGLKDHEVRSTVMETVTMSIAFEHADEKIIAEARELMRGVPTARLRTMMQHTIYSTGYGVARLTMLTQLRYFKGDGSVVLEYDPIGKLWLFGKEDKPKKRKKK